MVLKSGDATDCMRCTPFMALNCGPLVHLRRAVCRGVLSLKAWHVRLVAWTLTGLVSWLGQALSRFYSKHWGLLHLTYFDQIYNAMGGAENWLWVERGAHSDQFGHPIRK